MILSARTSFARISFLCYSYSSLCHLSWSLQCSSVVLVMYVCMYACVYIYALTIIYIYVLTSSILDLNPWQLTKLTIHGRSRVFDQRFDWRFAIYNKSQTWPSHTYIHTYRLCVRYIQPISGNKKLLQLRKLCKTECEAIYICICVCVCVWLQFWFLSERKSFNCKKQTYLCMCTYNCVCLKFWLS
jgi:hypothetical protein